MKLGRRRLLQGAGAALTLPMLESFLPKASAQGRPPTRLVVITTGQGTLLPRWTPPSADGAPLQLSELLMPLTPFRDQLAVVSRVSNRMPRYHRSNGHNAPGHTLLNAHLCTTSANADGQLLPSGSRTEVQQGTTCIGPSIDHAIAAQLGAPLPLNLTVNGTGLGENRMYYRVDPARPSEPRGARAEPRYINDPRTVFDELLASTGGGEGPTTLRDRLRGQRGRVIDAARSSYGSLSSRVSAADRGRLEAHAARLSDLERRLDSFEAATCDDPTLSMPAGYGDAGRADLHWQAQIDVMVTALSCNVTRVAAIHDSSYHGPSFPFLTAPIPDRLARYDGVSLPGGPVSGWHAQVHGDTGGRPNDNSNLAAGFRFYATQVAYLLDRMRAIEEPGGTLLDNSLVLWISEFGNGAVHSSDDLPVVLAGGAGGNLRGGRHIVASGATTGDLFTSMHRLLGLDVDSFGFAGDSDLQRGGISAIA